jgi:transglutaminase/protease-like cytokinesis protein 3
MEREMSTRDILKEKVGVCRQFVKIFSEMCQLANIRVKCIRGFAKGHTFVPGKRSPPDDVSFCS